MNSNVSEQDQIKLFKKVISEYFLNKADQLEVDSYYDLLVNDIRRDLMRSVSREINSLIRNYL